MKHVLVIGGTKGIGGVIAHEFAREGAVVSVIGRSHPQKQSDKKRRIHYFVADISDKKIRDDALFSIINKNGKLNSVVFSQRVRSAKDDWRQELDTTLSATKAIIEQLVGHFAKDNDKSIVIINSVANEFVIPSQSLGYHVAKAGLLQLARYLAVTLGPKGIRINCVSPATVLKDEAKKFYEKEGTFLRLFADIIPLGRMGTARDIYNLVEFLCSNKSAYITGQNITIDGGYYLLSPESLTRKYAKK